MQIFLKKFTKILSFKKNFCHFLKQIKTNDKKKNCHIFLKKKNPKNLQVPKKSIPLI